MVLFEERVALSTPGFRVTRENEAVVARLCQRLDGISLAIELAAVRMRTLSAEQILERLEDRFRLLTHGGRGAPERQQRLRGGRLELRPVYPCRTRGVGASVGVQGVFDLEAAKRVCSGDGLSAGQVGAAVNALVGKSLLIRVERPRRTPGYFPTHRGKPPRSYPGQTRFHITQTDRRVDERTAAVTEGVGALTYSYLFL